MCVMDKNSSFFTMISPFGLCYFELWWQWRHLLYSVCDSTYSLRINNIIKNVWYVDHSVTKRLLMAHTNFLIMNSNKIHQGSFWCFLSLFSLILNLKMSSDPLSCSSKPVWKLVFILLENLSLLSFLSLIEPYHLSLLLTLCSYMVCSYKMSCNGEWRNSLLVNSSHTTTTTTTTNIQD